MKNNFKLSLVILLAAGFANAKAPAPKTSRVAPESVLSESALMEELTGKKSENSKSFAAGKKAPLPVQHFLAGQKAAEEKNYILAIKHFNTVLKKYPQSQQVKATLIAKAKVYREMGLTAQADHNLQMARTSFQKPTTKKSAQALKTTERTKSVK